MDRLDQLFEQFLRARNDINNITASTREWCETAWKAFRDADLQYFVVHLRERGLKPVTCNTWIRTLNAFCRWLHEQGETATVVKLAPQRLRPA